jgi:small-conductance mechanosensitive channel/CRP-like cAMP-binding protein
VLILLRRFVLFVAAAGFSLWFYRSFITPDAALWLVIIGHIATALLALSFVLFVDTALRYFFWDGYLKKVLGANVPQLLPHTVSLIIYTATFVNLLRYDYGVSLAGALAASGFIAIILGFALRSVILDLFSGIAISVDKSYVVGDWITVTSRDFIEPVYGQVEDVDWRTTRLRLEDGTMFVMPNSLGGAFSITNHSQPRGPKRLEFTFLLPHETPHERAFRLLGGAVTRAMEVPGFYSVPEPRILINEITTDGVKYMVRFYADIHQHSPTSAISYVSEAVHEAVLRNNLSFPGEKVELIRRKEAHVEAGEQEITSLVALRQTPLLAETLTEDELGKLAGRAERRVFEPEQALITQAEEGDSLLILLSGAAAVFYKNGEAVPNKLAILSTGDVVGEMSLLTGMPRSASVIAQTQVQALEISKKDLAPLLEERPEIVERLSCLLAARAADQRRIDKSDAAQSEMDVVEAQKGFLRRIQQFFGLGGSA